MSDSRVTTQFRQDQRWRGLGVSVDLQLRSYRGVDLEVRDGRTIAGMAVPYGIPTTIREIGRAYTEVFVRGAFADDVQDPGSIALTARHPGSNDVLPVGLTRELREEAPGLIGAWYVSETSFGDEVLTLVRDGAISGLSIGFVAGDRDRWSADKTRVERTSARLDHVALVRVPAYPSARIAAVRSAQSLSRPRLNIARLRSK